VRAKIYSSLLGVLWLLFFISLNIVSLNPVLAYASSQVVVADVCTKSFSVIYNLSPYNGESLDFKVYDSSGRVLREGITIERSEAAGQASQTPQANKIIKFTVKGLTVNTSYFYQLFADGVAMLPTSNPLNYGEKYKVTTEKLDGSENLKITNGDIVTNDTLLLPEYPLQASSFDIGSSLVLVDILDSQNNKVNDYPLSSWVGSCSLDGQKYACINLNNLFSKQFHTPLELIGGDKIEITYLRQTQTLAESEKRFIAELPQEMMIYTSFMPAVIPQPRIAYFYHQDKDYDGYGSIEGSLFFSDTPPFGYTQDGSDCDDQDARVNPKAEEQCDGRDNNCDGRVDENLVRECSTVCGRGIETCQSGQWVGCTAQQPQPEICDGLDNNCDGRVDEDLVRECSTVCGRGIETCQSGQWVGCTAQQPQPEICGDNIDNDCDGEIDEDCCSGDLNGDGAITPADALIAFRCYLGIIGPCDPCVDVDKNGSVTPADALCLFRKYFSIPSCLD